MSKSARPDHTLPLAMAGIIALAMESFLFGMFSMLYAIAIWILLYRERIRGRSKINKVLCLTSSTLWLLCLAHFAIDIARAVQGFAVQGQRAAGGASRFYSILGDPTNVAKQSVYGVTTLIADCFVTYRLWVIWSRVWWIVPGPVLLLLATAVSGIQSCSHVAWTKEDQDVFTNSDEPWIQAFFSLSLATNLLATILIMGRLICARRRVLRHCTEGIASPYRKALDTVIQSAAIYSVALATLLGMYLLKSNAQYVFLDTIQPIIVSLCLASLLARSSLLVVMPSVNHHG
ncbi:hypothetical protein GY45DRAFT_432170 [Cubamyces sp. BRFM 1775]|nr:hypothetical protein GY45DRAFT_432170 [Cubamyces sp. BRFM 1775]